MPDTFAFELHPMDTLPGSMAAAQDLYIHEGAYAVVYGANARAIGWIDTHALFVGKVYRHHVIRQASGDRHD